MSVRSLRFMLGLDEVPWEGLLAWNQGLMLGLDAAKIDTGPIITHKAPLDGIGAAIERVLEREDEVVKTVITP